jgi:hypothetical protein
VDGKWNSILIINSKVIANFFQQVGVKRLIAIGRATKA